MYLVMLLLDEASAERLHELWRRLAEQGLPTLKDDWEPHITLAAFATSDKTRLLRDISSVSRDVASFGLRFDALGLFPQSGVLYTAPTPNVEMLELQAKLYAQLTPYAHFDRPFYTPGRWLPHCSLSVGASQRELIRGLELILRTWHPLAVRARGLTLVRTADSSLVSQNSGAGQNILYRSFHAQ